VGGEEAVEGAGAKGSSKKIAVFMMADVEDQH
jgi:hypothetical protein